MKILVPDWLIYVAAGGQLFTGLVYPYVRHAVLDWYNDLRKLKPLNHRIAKTYGVYIQSLNLLFGVITLLLKDELQNGTGLAVALTALIACYWIGRVITLFIYLPVQDIPDRLFFKIGAFGINTLIIVLAIVFVLLCIENLGIYFG